MKLRRSVRSRAALASFRPARLDLHELVGGEDPRLVELEVDVLLADEAHPSRVIVSGFMMGVTKL